MTNILINLFKNWTDSNDIFIYTQAGIYVKLVRYIKDNVIKSS